MAQILAASDAPRRVGDDVIRAHAKLRSLILDCTLKPGSRVPQAELARLVGVGRTPLREALRMLQQEDLVRAELNKRITIVDLDLDDLDCTYAHRISIESTAMRITAPLLNDRDFHELDGSLAQMRDAMAANDRDEFEVPHRRFHQLLVSHVQDRARARMARDADSAERVRRFLMKGDQHALARADSEHREILDACRDGDGVRASRLLASHLARSALFVINQLDPAYDTILTRMALRMVLGEEGAQGTRTRGSVRDQFAATTVRSSR